MRAKKRAKVIEVEEIISDVNRPYQSEDADVILVSSDGLKFKVHSYHLKAASTVFSSMLDIGIPDQSNLLEFTDNEIEHSRIVVLFLNLVYGKELHFKKETRHYNHEQCYRLVSFLLKYDATTPLRMLRYATHLWLAREALSPFCAFRIGAKMDDVDLCAQALRCCAGWNWSRNDNITEEEKRKRSFDLNNTVWNGPCLDPSSWRIATFKEIPDKYLTALLRACRESMKLVRSQNDWIKIGDKFAELMRAMRNAEKSKA
ncbi:hypothetical protein IAR55_004493 [Kwoniella newhampshirensis]|uniref:BTB domain-containing protein n=1 Tax=Kwoniella newhampshirensis TaxID=1651941 RepID=A0AAW0YXS5_9TREE